MLHEQGLCDWQLAAGNIRNENAGLINALHASGGSYTLQTIAPNGTHRHQRISAISEIIRYEDGLQPLINRGAQPNTKIISFTVTEAGYYLDPQHQLQASHDEIQHDLNAWQQNPRTLYGVLTAILHKRQQQNSDSKLTLLCCDNVRHNGDTFKKGLTQFVSALGNDELLQWIEENCTCPNSMVDRITPRPDAQTQARIQQATGEDDATAATALMAEAYIQWVIEDNFAAGRPAWEQAGAQLTDDVTPFEEAKIRLLNATHTCLAWGGALLGMHTIHESVSHPALRQFAYDYATHDAIPLLQPSPINLEEYRDIVLERFSNAAIADTTARVASDGFAKLPGFVTPTIAARIAQGQSIEHVAVIPALFLAFLRAQHAGKIPTPYEDQAMPTDIPHQLATADNPIKLFAAQKILWGALASTPPLIQALTTATKKTHSHLNIAP